MFLLLTFTRRRNLVSCHLLLCFLWCLLYWILCLFPLLLPYFSLGVVLLMLPYFNVFLEYFCLIFSSGRRSRRNLVYPECLGSTLSQLLWMCFNASLKTSQLTSFLSIKFKFSRSFFVFFGELCKNCFYCLRRSRIVGANSNTMAKNCLQWELGNSTSE